MGRQTIRWSWRMCTAGLEANYAFVVNWIAKQKPSWETIAAKMAREGIVGAKGKQPAGRLRQAGVEAGLQGMWRRQRERELAEEVDAQAAARARAPNRCRFGEEVSARSASDLATAIGGWAWQCREAAKSHTRW